MSSSSDNRSNVRLVTGNVLDSPAQTIVNTVNCVGVMGKGVALAFKKRYPDMFKDYVARCEAQQLYYQMACLTEADVEPVP